MFRTWTARLAASTGSPGSVKRCGAASSQGGPELSRGWAAGSAYNDQGLVFSDELGDLVSPDWFTRATKRFATEAGVPALTPHAAARHTWATLALSSGVHPKMVQERPGHSSIALTMDRYSHVIDGMDREAAELVAALYRCCKSFAGSIHSTQRTC